MSSVPHRGAQSQTLNILPALMMLCHAVRDCWSGRKGIVLRDDRGGL